MNNEYMKIRMDAILTNPIFLKHSKKMTDILYEYDKKKEL